MGKNIIREVAEPDFEFYFDGDMYNQASGDYNNTLFVVCNEYYGYSNHYYSALNEKDFDQIKRECSNVLDEVESLTYWKTSNYVNIKEIMEDYKLKYSPYSAHKLIELSKENDFECPAVLAAYLTIKTGKKWDTYSSRGCCQGDYAEIVFCTSNYTEKELNVISDMYWGMGKEFCILFDGEEDNAVYGYYIADCEFRSNDEIKTYFCKMEDFKEEETILEVISGQHTVTVCDYETV